MENKIIIIIKKIIQTISILFPLIGKSITDLKDIWKK